MNKYNDKGERYGPWKLYKGDGTILGKGRYLNDECIGFWEWYFCFSKVQETEFWL